MDWYVCGMGNVTRAHRSRVAIAYEGDERLSVFVKRWVEGEGAIHPNVESALESLERMAQLLADAEGASRKLRFVQDRCWKEHGHHFADDKCLWCLFERAPTVAVSGVGKAKPPEESP